jgi:hypothetical protein
MYARITKVRIPNTVVTDELIEDARGLMPAVSQMAGHRGAIWLIERSTGTGVAIDLYETAEDLENTSQGDLRDALLTEIGAELVSVEEFEVAGLDRVLS